MNQSNHIECINLSDQRNISNGKQYALARSLVQSVQIRVVFQVGGDVANVGREKHRIHANSDGMGGNRRLFVVERLRL